MSEVVLEDYIGDAFAVANGDNEGLFLTHLTSTSRHPFNIPGFEDENPAAKTSRSGKRILTDLSKYSNAIGYVD